jgi:hypothetical protein
VGRSLTIPHRPKDGMCPVNGIRDLIQWRSCHDWSNEFLWGLGQGGSFAYLRFKDADPPRQVYWGTAGPRQHRYLAELLNADYIEIENRTFKFSWNKAREALDAGTPPVLGPLDMFYLPFYQGIYHLRHIPIHYFLLAGYDEEKAYIYDTGADGLQEISLEDLQLAWDVSVPGLGKRNRLVILDLPHILPPAADLVKKSIFDQCQTMLEPPVSMLGIPAMEKLAGEIAGWPEEFGENTAARCSRQVREYLNSPPDLEGDHLTAGRDLYLTFLREAETMVNGDFSEAISAIQASMAVLPVLADSIQHNQLDAAAECFHHIAEIEGKAFRELRETVTDNTY